MLDLRRVKKAISELEEANRGLDADEGAPAYGWHRDMLNKALIPLKTLLLDAKRTLP